MKAPRITLTDLAVADILEQADWYEAQADRKLAKRWEQAVTSTLLRISQKPDAGSLCTFKADELHGTRTRVAEVLNRRRSLSISMIRRLHLMLGISAEVLIQPSLAGAVKKRRIAG